MPRSPTRAPKKISTTDIVPHDHDRCRAIEECYLTDQPEPICPHSHPNCPFLEELVQLQKRCQRLESLSRIDELTGYYNYRHLLVSLDTEMERTRRTGDPTAVVIADLDHFKSVNDIHGHDIGNRVLQSVTRTWQECIRRTDIPCRFGGEEFLLILPNTLLSHAMQTAERLRSALEIQPLSFGPAHVTASFGVTLFDGLTPMSAMEVIRAADSQLLRAKSEGRNRVCSDQSVFDAGQTELTTDERRQLVTK